jgi:predicted  nucleic acid-binding Zn-ribbon protein
MTESLSDGELQLFRELSDELEGEGLEGIAIAIDLLIAEVERLRERESDLIEDIEMFGGAMHALVMGQLGQEVLTAERIAEIIRGAAVKTERERRELEAEVARLRAENANLRRELDAATAALETQGQAAFIAGMRTKSLGEAGS